jgi:hypothetical protein
MTGGCSQVGNSGKIVTVIGAIVVTRLTRGEEIVVDIQGRSVGMNNTGSFGRGQQEVVGVNRDLEITIRYKICGRVPDGNIYNL